MLPVAAVTLCLTATGCGASSDPVRIGIVTACANNGYFARSNPSLVAGAELPLLDRGGTPAGPAPSNGVRGASVAGRPAQLEVGCSQPYDPESALAALQRLVESQHVDAVVTPTAENDPIVARYARRHRGVVFMLGDYGQSETLRFPSSNMFRFEEDGAQWSAGLAAYAYHQLGWRQVTTIGEADPPGWVGAAGFDAEFCSLGGRVQRLWASAATTDPTPWPGACRPMPTACSWRRPSTTHQAS